MAETIPMTAGRLEDRDWPTDPISGSQGHNGVGLGTGSGYGQNCLSEHTLSTNVGIRFTAELFYDYHFFIARRVAAFIGLGAGYTYLTRSFSARDGWRNYSTYETGPDGNTYPMSGPIVNYRQTVQYPDILLEAGVTSIAHFIDIKAAARLYPYMYVTDVDNHISSGNSVFIDRMGGGFGYRIDVELAFHIPQAYYISLFLKGFYENFTSGMGTTYWNDTLQATRSRTAGTYYGCSFGIDFGL
jgi:outer membrane protease